jgi:RHS repeat-associated protein
MEWLKHQNNGSRFGRILTFVAGTNKLNTLEIGAASYHYQYDSNGNLTQENASRFFEWDHSDRLRSFRTQAGNSEPSVYTHYLYDAAGQRVKKITRKSGADMNSTVYVDDMYEYRRERSGGTTRNNNNLHVMDNEKRIAIRRIGNPFPGDSAPAVQYHLGNHLGSSHLVIDETGAWTNREDFTPFGETSFGSFAQKRYRFTGKERDEESGLSYHTARYYSPCLTRWISCEPEFVNQIPSTAHNFHSYSYTSNNPLRFHDPNGRWLESVWDAASLAVGVASFVDNVRQGNVGSAIMDGVGIVADSAALVLPVVPGGAGMAIKAARGTEKVVDAAQTLRQADRAVDTARQADRAVDAARQTERATDAAQASRQGERASDASRATSSNATYTPNPDIQPHGQQPSPRPQGTQSHHPEQQTALSRNIENYSSNRDPSLLMSTPQHRQTFKGQAQQRARGEAFECEIGTPAALEEASDIMQHAGISPETAGQVTLEHAGYLFETTPLSSVDQVLSSVSP